MKETPEAVVPSLTSLRKALAIAVAVAGVLLVLVVLPAEYNIDITGFGGSIGLTALAAPPEELPTPPDLEGTATSAREPAAPDHREDQVVIDLPPGKGLEYKFRIKAGGKVKYSWSSDSDGLLYDFHAEPDGAAKDVFESFASGQASAVKGTFTAPFDGNHGWYWKNRGMNPVKVTLDTSGPYQVLGIR